MAAVRPAEVLDVGCASGELAERLFWSDGSVSVRKGVTYYGIDSSAEQIQHAQRRHGDAGRFQVARAECVSFPDSSFDLVIVCEVLEHLERPGIALMEIARLTRKFALISVPWEPVWRICNYARGAYLSQFGNTPGHVQYFSRKGIRALVAPHFEILKELHPFPWTMLLLQKRQP
ncbi:MAG: class I SAM-dependent methyltransferase [Pirellulales bacterium]|nr:class I SAM-dependent methyltransferase [Pirellulales bacterium]